MRISKYRGHNAKYGFYFENKSILLMFGYKRILIHKKIKTNPYFS